MSLLTGIKNRLYSKSLAKQLRDSNPVRQTLNIQQAKTVGILFDCTLPENIVVINNFAQGYKEDLKRVYLFGYFNTKKDYDFGFPYFNKKDINWFGRPGSRQVRDFIEQDLDILVNAYLGDSPSLEYVSALSQAKFRIGRYHPSKVDCSDFMFKVREDISLEDYLKQIKYYLNYVKGFKK